MARSLEAGHVVEIPDTPTLADGLAGQVDEYGLEVGRRLLDEMQQQTRTRQVLEEANAQARTVGSTFDQTRNVRDHEALPAIDADHTQVRHQRGERVVGNFRLGGRY